MVHPGATSASLPALASAALHGAEVSMETPPKDDDQPESNVPGDCDGVDVDATLGSWEQDGFETSQARQSELTVLCQPGLRELLERRLVVRLGFEP